MIATKDFVWLHFPKCGGTTTERFLHSAFADEPSAVFDPIKIDNVIWHQSIPARKKYDPSFELGDRHVICNIRRLPTWLLSRVYFEFARPPHHTVTRSMLVEGAFREHSGFVQKADDYAKHYTRPRVDHWIRTENLYEDMRAVFSRYKEDINCPASEEKEKKINASKIKYIEDLSFYFTGPELKHLYESNPLWARIEEEIYGSLLTIE